MNHWEHWKKILGFVATIVAVPILFEGVVKILGFVFGKTFGAVIAVLIVLLIGVSLQKRWENDSDKED